VETAQLGWFNNAKEKSPIDGLTLQNQARKFTTSLGIPETEFAASVGWLQRFKKRHGIVQKKVCGKAKSVDQATNEYASWQRQLHTILNEYEPSEVFNADETALFYRAMPDRTLEYKSVQCYGHKVNKHLIVLLAIQ